MASAMAKSSLAPHRDHLVTQPFPSRKQSARLGALCLLVLAIILVAGLWPFRAPRNDVVWLSSADGLFFGRHGSVLSAGAFPFEGPETQASGSLEIAFEPARSKGRKTILAFDGAKDRRGSFSLQQDGHALVVHRLNVDGAGVSHLAETFIDGVLIANKPVFATIVLAPAETSVYLDGVPVKKSRIGGAVTGGFQGRLILANALTASDSWSGKITQLAIYRNQLSPEQISLHFSDWTEGRPPSGATDPSQLALYRFQERAGSVVHNERNPATDLVIPARYFVLRPEFLSLPWLHYHPTWAYWQDVAVNIAGFVPFGFVFSAYFSDARMIRYPAALVILLGFSTSLLIEVLQAYLPTRDSGVNDLITNTLGTACGVALYRSSAIRTILSRVPFLERNFSFVLQRRTA